MDVFGLRNYSEEIEDCEEDSRLFDILMDPSFSISETIRNAGEIYLTLFQIITEGVVSYFRR